MAKKQMAVRIVFDAFPALIAATPTQRTELVRSTALFVEADAKRRAPVRTGALRRSIQSVIRAAAAVVRVGVDYGVYVEYGTHRMPARPYLRPAVEAAVPRLHDLAVQLFSFRGVK